MENRNAYENRGLRSPGAIVTNIINKRRYYPDKEFVSFLIVEGSTDSKFYKTLVDPNKCEVTFADGKSDALDVLAKLEKDAFRGILAIVDADFDILEGKSPHSPNLLFTDTHDLETMIIESPALDKVLVIYGSEEKIEQVTESAKKDVRTLLLESGMTVGYLRWVSLREDLSLRFDGLPYDRFMKGLQIKEAGLITEVKNKSQRPDIASAQLSNYIQGIRDKNHDSWHVCCGHDLVEILSAGLRKTIGSYGGSDVKIKRENLTDFLLAAFERSHFYKTQLYLSIQQWEEANKPFVVLASE